MIPVDLYSDTVTLPTEAMRQAIASAAVGDDQRGEDPSVNELQERGQALFGVESAIFLPTATMANQIALKCSSTPGSEVVAEKSSHVLHFECGGPAIHSGLMARGIQGKDGTFDVGQLSEVVRSGSLHSPGTAVVWIENTHNMAGGTAWPIDKLASVGGFCHDRGLRLHIDGARLFNAVVASGCSATSICSHADTVTICFSKGLGCPAGALLLGPATTIDLARRYKHLFGGALRQAGVLAAACNFALDHHIERLNDDHVNAKRLARGISTVEGLEIDVDRVQTNIVYFTCSRSDATEFQRRCLNRGVRFSLSEGRLRGVTHLDIDTSDVDYAIEVVHGVVQELAA